MLAELLAVRFEKIMQTRSYTVVALSAKDKRFAIYCDPSVGRILQLHLAGARHPRPLTHELLQGVVDGFNIKVKQVVINDLDDTVYHARLYLEQKVGEHTHIIEVDGRPSDCLMLALMNSAPLYITQDVLDRTVPLEAP